MMNVKVRIYNGVKYDLRNEKVTDVCYNNIKGYEVVTGEKATLIGNETDEYNEYLIIYLETGETATFCNSHVDLFII